jgi:hypothetical protein
MNTQYYIQRANFLLINKILDRNFGVIETRFTKDYSICNEPLKPNQNESR